MKKFKHYILTRFNLGIYSEDNPYSKTVKDPVEWMEHRIELFENTAFESICNQTCKDFVWLIAFDPATPKDVILRYDYCDNINICYEHPSEYLKTEAAESEWIITTRFDNDDYLFPEFVETIQSEFREQVEIIDIDYKKRGYLSDLELPSERKAANSPFLSLVEKWENIDTAFAYKHSDMPNYYPARKLNKVLAYQIIHTRNVMNKF